MALINRTLFFSVVRANPFGGKLTQLNVDGCTAILDEWDRAQQGGDLNALGYILATAFGETGTMKWDVREGAPRGESRNSYFTRMYDLKGSRPHVAAMLGNTQPGDGARFYGRSLPQITGRGNYAKFQAITGIPLVENPDLALVKETGVRILFEGMFRGVFTGRKLGDYFDGKPHDDAELRRRRIAARAIINGRDKAEMFARVAAAFTMALNKASVGRAALFDAVEALPPLAPVPGFLGLPGRRKAPLPPAGPVPGLPPILEDVAPAIISAAVSEATGGKVSLPVDRGKPLLQSLTLNGGVLAGVPGILAAVTAIQDRWVAFLVVGLIVGGMALVLTGRLRIRDEAGV